MGLDEAWRLVAYCGLNCGECSTYKGKHFRMLAEQLKELIEAYHHPEWVPKYGHIDFNYDEFLNGLTCYAKVESGCFNVEPCKGRCQVPGCPIKPCAIDRGVEVCFECGEFPCADFSQFLEGHPDQIGECQEFKKNRDEWLKAHIRKTDRGYCRATNKYYIRAKQNPQDVMESIYVSVGSPNQLMSFTQFASHCRRSIGGYESTCKDLTRLWEKTDLHGLTQIA